MRKRKGLALVLCIALIMSLMPTSLVFADNQGIKDGAEKTKVSLVYMNYIDSLAANPTSATAITTSDEEDAGFNATSCIVETKPEIPTLKVGDSFFVGVKVSDIDSIVESVDGLNNFTVVLDYNQEYLSVESFNASSMPDKMTYRLGRKTENGGLLSAKSNYDYGYNSSTNSSSASGSIVCGIMTNTQPPEYKGETEEYIAIMKFKVNKLPENGLSNAIVLNEGSETYQISFGENGQSASYEAHASSSLAEITSVVQADSSQLTIFPQQYTISYNKNLPEGTTTSEDEVITTQAITENEKTLTAAGIELPAGPTAPEGYFFTGWYQDQEAKTAFTADTEITASTTIYAGWTEGYRVIFDANGKNASFSDGKTTTSTSAIEPGKTIATGEIPTATRTDYTFNGWNNKANGSGDITLTQEEVASYAVVTPTALYAQWTPTDPNNAVTVTFHKNDGTDADTIGTVSVVNGDAVGTAMPDEPTRENYSFGGWFTSNENNVKTVFTSETAITTDTAVYAKWINPTEKKTVTFNANGGSGQADPATIDVHVGDSIGEVNMPVPPTKENSRFSGWATSSGALVPDFNGRSKVSEDITVYAVWDSVVTVTLDAQGGQINGALSTTSTSVYANDKLELSTYAVTAPDGYDFWYWSTEPNGTGEIYRDAIENVPGSMTLYAIYQGAKPPVDPTNPDDKPIVDEDNNYMVQFHDNGATTFAAVTNPYYVRQGKSLALAANQMPTAQREGYDFVSWNTDPAGAGETITYGSVISELINNGEVLNVYAQWKASENEVTVTFHKNDQSGDTVLAAVSLKSGDSLSVGDPAYALVPQNVERTGYQFNGWKSTTDQTNYAELSTKTAVTANMDVYATWSAELTFEIDPDTANAVYNGTSHEVTVTTISALTGENLTNQFEKGKDYVITYTSGEAVVAAPTDAGTYKINIEMTSSSIKTDIEDDYTVSRINVTQMAISPSVISVNVTGPVGQKSTLDGEGKAKALLSIEITGSGILPEENDYSVVYYKWTDNGDGYAEQSELASTTVVPAEIAKYIAAVEFTSNNFAVGTVNGVAPKVTGAGLNIEHPILYEITPDVQLDGIKIAPGDAENYEQPYQIYSDSDMKTTTEITPGTSKEYYLRVPDSASTSGIKIGFEGILPDGSITLSGSSVTIKDVSGASEGGVVKETDGIVLDPADKGSFNTITVTVNDVDYTFHIQQLVAPKINLNFGNSPYGEIMKDVSITDKAAAKAAFDLQNKYSNEYLPQNASDKTKMYPTRAWTDINNPSNPTDEELAKVSDSNINMDRNETAIFIYNQQGFVDPGFVATDSAGNEVELLNRRIEVKRMPGFNLSSLADSKVTTDEINLSNGASNLLITEITPKYQAGDSKTNIVRPDIYKMEYAFFDSATSTTITAIRNVVVLNKDGDTDFSTNVNDADKNAIDTYILKRTSFDNITTDSAKRILFFRMFDTDRSNIVNDADKNMIDRYILKTMPVEPLYVSLPDTL